MSFIQAFFGGFFFANALPHLIKAIIGQKHMTLISRESSVYVNVLWAFGNFLISFVILGFNPKSGFLNLPTGVNFWAFVLGAFVMTNMCAWLFSRKKRWMPWHKE